MQWHIETLFDNNNPLDYIGNNKVIIAVIDSGIDDSHVDLEECVINKYLISGLDENNNINYEENDTWSVAVHYWIGWILYNIFSSVYSGTYNALV